ncbi:MAG TPA: ATP-binding cassette domain-containing protein [Pyrinomonadaceae bacterium]|nr:ATP-binding cassette domain-containing protein [Pyrinomonadaceae bacterium]
MLSVAIRKRLGDGRREAFDLDVSFTADEGTTILFGHSGSGKTTTLRAIAGVETPDAGRIVLDDQVYFDAAARINMPVRRRRVGFVFQDYALFPHLTAEQNIAYGVKAQGKRERRARAREMLALFGIEHTRHRLPVEMSGGEQQRAALARALASDPSIVLLDEPLSAVDSSTRERLLEEIKSAQRTSGILFIYVTHNRAEAERIGRRIIIFNEGRVIEEKELND